MTRLLTSTAIGLIAAFGMQAQAQDSNDQTAQMEGPCTAQWVAVDENNDGTISQSEAEAAIDAQFSQIDRDGDGMISVKNWKDCTAPSAIPGGFQSAEGTGTERTPASAETGTAGTSEQAQASGDAGQQTQASGETGQQAQASGQSGQQDQTGQQAQASGDAGQQNMESTRALQAPEGGSTETPADWSDEQFGELDADQSGYITSEEAGEWTRNRVTGTMDDEETLGRYGAMFSMMDMDADGRITQEEWDAREQMDIESRFGRVDQNGDDQVSLNEWRDYRGQRFEQAQAETGEDPTIWMYYFRSL